MGKIAQKLGGGRPLFERLKGRKPLSYGFLPFVTFAYTHFKMVEAMHAPLILLVFKISEVRRLDVSAFSGRRDFRKL